MKFGCKETTADFSLATGRGYQNQTRRQSRTRAIRSDGGEDEQEARRAPEEEGEAQQDAEVMSSEWLGDIQSIECGPGNAASERQNQVHGCRTRRVCPT